MNKYQALRYIPIKVPVPTMQPLQPQLVSWLHNQSEQNQRNAKLMNRH